jgi:transcriptional regulator with XRE-family HTH domain
MLSESLKKGIQAYAIGDKLRVLRLKKKMGLVELGGHTGLSAAMLSKVERGKLFPTLPTLLRIAMVFSVGLEYFFADDSKRHVLAIVRRNERKRFRSGRTGETFRFTSNRLILRRAIENWTRITRSFNRCRRGGREGTTTAAWNFCRYCTGSSRSGWGTTSTYWTQAIRFTSIRRCLTRIGG